MSALPRSKNWREHWSVPLGVVLDVEAEDGDVRGESRGGRGGFTWTSHITTSLLYLLTLGFLRDAGDITVVVRGGVEGLGRHGGGRLDRRGTARAGGEVRKVFGIPP